MKKHFNYRIILILVIVSSFLFSNFNNHAFGQADEVINSEIKNLNTEINAKRDRLKKIQEQQKIYSDSIKQKQSEQSSLKNQLAILDNRQAKAELDIESVKIEIDRITLEMEKVNLEIDAKNKEIEKEKSHIESVLNLMYKQGQISSLEIILINNSLADFMNQSKYLEDLNSEIGKSLDSLKIIKINLENNKQDLEKKNKDMALLKTDLEEKIIALDTEKETKQIVLFQVKNSERTYQRLLAQAKKEQEDAAAEIVNMEKAVRERLASLSGKELKFNDNGLIWPVPQNTITTFFHDPDYPFRYIFEHPAVDIRAAQGTTLRAAASGYVARAKNAGMGYSYIMLVHGNGISTVYGHVSRLLVKEDEYIVQGQIIGQTGGMPGTPGAGNLTTGPHLHFEVRSNGIPVNPMEYLP